LRYINSHLSYHRTRNTSKRKTTRKGALPLEVARLSSCSRV